ncbi:MAG TPA: glutamate synthase subunit beta [Solibacterales bacterium]|nr:glutamate synthase subunit beta [Bryobacterales bacterium]
MIRLTIDGRPMAVEPGTTILGAAEWLGIRIPTMCHVKGIEPASSCFVCAVQIEGRSTLSPACAMPAADGMVVHTQTEEVRKARRMAIELLLSDHAGECEAPCAARCPAGLDIPGFLYGIASGDNGRAMEVIAKRLALAGSLGRVCPRLCEQTCRRCELDHGLTIGALHRYVADHDLEQPKPFLPERAAATGKNVAIIGAGPAGLSAAYYLHQQGHACTLFDAHPHPGGMLRYGIPAYRLPKDALDAEIAAVGRLGAEFRMGACWGKDFSLAELRERYQAVFVAIGAQQAQSLRCPGEESALPGVGFLERVETGDTPALGDDVIVVGGGNTAMDCARTAIRLGARVRVFYRRTRQEMPCLMEEVEGAEAEGVHMEYLVAPVRLERTGRGLSLICRRMMLGEPDASGRRSPVPVEGSDFTVGCSTVIAAIGQSVERSLAEREGLNVTRWGIAADAQTMATNLPGVFAGGDAVLGADLAVRAVAAGRMAATSIQQYLSGEAVTGEPVSAGVVMNPVDDSERAAIFRSIEKAPRIALPELPMERRLTTFDEVEGRLPAAAALVEARRCMTCGCRKSACCTIRVLATEYGADVNRFGGERRRFAEDTSHPEIVYEPGKCISCDACVRLAAADGEPFGLTMVGRGFDVRVAAPFGKPLAEALTRTARRCAEVCPTGALSIRTERACQCQ